MARRLRESIKASANLGYVTLAVSNGRRDVLCSGFQTLDVPPVHPYSIAITARRGRDFGPVRHGIYPFGPHFHPLALCRFKPRALPSALATDLLRLTNTISRVFSGRRW